MAQEAASTLGGHAIVQDLANEDGPAAAVFEAVDAMGGLDLLVANTGGPAPGAFDALDDDAWLRAIEGTLLSVLRHVHAALPHLRAGTDPAITSSTSRRRSASQFRRSPHRTSCGRACPDGRRA